MDWNDYKSDVDEVVMAATSAETAWEDEELCDLIANLERVKDEADSLLEQLEKLPEAGDCE